MVLKDVKSAKTLEYNSKKKTRRPGETGYQLNNGGGNADLTQHSLQPFAHRNYPILNNEILSRKLSRHSDQRSKILP